MDKIIELINLIENYLTGLYVIGVTGSIIGTLASCGLAVLGEEFIVAISAAALRKALYSAAARTAIAASTGGLGSFNIALVLEILKNKVLKWMYEKHLEKTK